MGEIKSNAYAGTVERKWWVKWAYLAAMSWVLVLTARAGMRERSVCCWRCRFCSFPYEQKNLSVLSCTKNGVTYTPQWLTNSYNSKAMTNNVCLRRHYRFPFAQYGIHTVTGSDNWNVSAIVRVWREHATISFSTSRVLTNANRNDVFNSDENYFFADDNARENWLSNTCNGATNTITGNFLTGEIGVLKLKF